MRSLHAFEIHHLNNENNISQNKYLTTETILAFVKCYMVGRKNVFGMHKRHRVGRQRDGIPVEPRSPALILVAHPASCKRVSGLFHETKAAEA